MSIYKTLFGFSDEQLLSYINTMKASAKDGFAKRRYHREFTPYGMCMHTTGRSHYIFNRDYLVLPIEFPFLLLQGAFAVGFHCSRGIQGHGRYRPEIGDSKEWHTVYFFNDEFPPMWHKRTREYDKSKYL